MAETSTSGLMDDTRIENGIRWQAEHCRRNGAPVTARLIEAQVPLMKTDSAVGRRIANWPGLPLEDAMPLRLTGGFHHLLLTGDEQRLEPVYREDITEQAAVDAIVASVVADHDARLLAWLDGPPQTNEAGRSASFMAGLMWLSGRLGARFELNELGASAGINSMMDRYHFDLRGVTIGPDESSMRIKPEWRGPPPPNNPVEIVAIKGCDQSPIDLSDPDAALRVKSYVWPENAERIVRMDAAIALAAQKRPDVVQADALDWVLQRIPAPQDEGVTRVINHSIVWQYIPAEKRAAITAAIEAAGANSTPSKPLAWMMLETNRETLTHELTLRYWPGGATSVLLGQAQAHGTWVEWFES